MPYTCPHCQKTVKHLKDHIKRMHPDKVEGEQSAGELPPPGAVNNKVDKKRRQCSPAETLKIKKPESQTEYHCVDCGTNITQNQEQCPGCGGQLDWSALNGKV